MTKITTEEQIEEIKEALGRRLLSEEEADIVRVIIEHSPALIKVGVVWKWILQMRNGAIWVAGTIGALQYVWPWASRIMGSE